MERLKAENIELKKKVKMGEFIKKESETDTESEANANAQTQIENENETETETEKVEAKEKETDAESAKEEAVSPFDEEDVHDTHNGQSSGSESEQESPEISKEL